MNVWFCGCILLVDEVIWLHFCHALFFHNQSGLEGYIKARRVNICSYQFIYLLYTLSDLRRHVLLSCSSCFLFLTMKSTRSNIFVASVIAFVCRSQSRVKGWAKLHHFLGSRSKHLWFHLQTSKFSKRFKLE